MSSVILWLIGSLISYYGVRKIIFKLLPVEDQRFYNWDIIILNIFVSLLFSIVWLVLILIVYFAYLLCIKIFPEEPPKWL